MNPSKMSSSRRSFLKSSAVAGAYVIGSRALASSRRNSVIVIGAGAFGGWTAFHLLKKGAKVTLLDAWGPGNSRSSSGGETRIIRGVYGPDRIYVDWTARSFGMWREAERRWGRRLYRRTGVLWMTGEDDAYVRESMPFLEDA